MEVGIRDTVNERSGKSRDRNRDWKGTWTENENRLIDTNGKNKISGKPQK